MILSAHQPNYLPSAMLLNKIALSDRFVFLSHVQFVGRSWQQRNRIRNGDAAIWLTLPVIKKGHRFQAIADVELATDQDWRHKHLASLRCGYGKRPYFDAYFPTLERLYRRDWTHLADLDIALTRQMLEWLDIGTPLADSRDLNPGGSGNELLIDLCRKTGADQYVSNIGSRAYIDEAAFAAAGVRHRWQDFSFPTYDQGAPFLERLSALDLLFNLGPAAGDLVRTGGCLKDGLDAVVNLYQEDSEESP